MHLGSKIREAGPLGKSCSRSVGPERISESADDILRQAAVQFFRTLEHQRSVSSSIQGEGQAVMGMLEGIAYLNKARDPSPVVAVTSIHAIDTIAEAGEACCQEERV